MATGTWTSIRKHKAQSEPEKSGVMRQDGPSLKGECEMFKIQRSQNHVSVTYLNDFNQVEGRCGVLLPSRYVAIKLIERLRKEKDNGAGFVLLRDIVEGVR